MNATIHGLIDWKERADLCACRCPSEGQLILPFRK